MSCSGYCLASSNSFNSDSLWSLCSFLVQILTILRDSENGIDLDVALGWHDDGSRYRFLSVSFLNRSILIFYAQNT